MGNNIVLLQTESPAVAIENDAPQLSIDSQVAVESLPLAVEVLQEVVEGQTQSEPTEVDYPSDERRSIDDGGSLMHRFTKDREETEGEGTERYFFPLRSSSFPLRSDSQVFSEADWCERRQSRRPEGMRSVSEDLLQAQLEQALFCQEAMTSYSNAKKGNIKSLLDLSDIGNIEEFCRFCIIVKIMKV